MRLLFFTLLYFGVSLLGLRAQDNFDHWLDIGEDFRIQPYFQAQLWASQSFGQEIFDTGANRYEAVDNRFNVMVRRGRLGFRGAAYQRLNFKITAAYDLAGRDVLAAPVGGANNGRPNFSIWDAYMRWRIKPESEAFNLVGGYFRPQIGRESITSAWRVSSMEKSMSQFYLRQHLVGRGPGHTMGLNLGGLLQSDENFGINYNLGIFNPAFDENGGNSAGRTFAPLWVGRVVLELGDPEMTNYSIGYRTNYFGERQGVSIGLAGAYQGETDQFDRSYTLGADLLLNWGALNLNGEWSFMWRDGRRPKPTNGLREFSYGSNTGYVRLSYNLILGNRYWLEPSLMVMQFNGGKTTTEQADALAVEYMAGSETTYDVGLNWHLNRDALTLLLHYTWREGDAGAAAEGAAINQFFSQAGAGAIRRGDWLGVGLNIRL